MKKYENIVIFCSFVAKSTDHIKIRVAMQGDYRNSKISALDDPFPSAYMYAIYCLYDLLEC
jgi:hypothetical protein